MCIPPVLPGWEKVLSKATATVAIRLCQRCLSLGPRQEDVLVQGSEGAVAGLVNLQLEGS